MKSVSKKNIEYDKLFVIIASILGLIYLFLAPLYTGSDEHTHFFRAYAISDGYFKTPIIGKKVGGYLPKSLSASFKGKKYNASNNIKYKDIKYMASIKLDKSNKKIYGNDYSDTYSNTSLYSFVQYLPVLIGINLGKLFNLNPYYMGMLARFTNLIVYIIICTIGFKFLPRLKNFFLLMMSSPVLLSSAATLSSDAFTCALVFLLLALILYLKKSKHKLKIYHIILLSILSILIANCKIVYFPVVFMLIFIPSECYQNKWEKYVFLVSTIIISIVTNLIWLNQTKAITDLVYTKTSLEIESVLHNPINYIFVLIYTFIHYFFSLLLNSFGSLEMYHSQLHVPIIVSIIGIILYIWAILTDKDKNLFKNKDKIIIFIISLFIMVLISSAIYTEFTANFVKFDNNLIVGLQGRYFIPSIMLIAMIIPSFLSKIKKLDQIISYKCLIIISLILHGAVFWTMYHTFL